MSKKVERTRLTMNWQLSVKACNRLDVYDGASGSGKKRPLWWNAIILEVPRNASRKTRRWRLDA